MHNTYQNFKSLHHTVSEGPYFAVRIPTQIVHLHSSFFISLYVTVSTAAMMHARILT